LRAWSRDFVDDVLGPLRDPRLEALGPSGRGLVYQLERGLTSITRRQGRDQIRALGENERDLLAALDIAIGARFVYAEDMLDHAAVERRAAIASAWFGRTLEPKGPALPWRRERDRDQLLTLGYAHLGVHAVRVDVVEDIVGIVEPLARAGPFTPPAELEELVTLPMDAIARILLKLGYDETADGFIIPRRRSRRGARRSR
jgi:hypothetical protein